MTARTFGYLSFVLLGVFVFFRFLIPYLFPFVLALFLALVLEPQVQFLMKKLNLKRTYAALLVVLGLVAIMVSLFAWGITRVLTELTDLYGYLPQYYTEFNSVLAQMLQFAGDVSEKLPGSLALVAQEQWNRLYSLVATLVTGAGGIVKGVPSVTVTTLFTLLATYFLLRDRSFIISFFRTMIPPKSFSSLEQIETGIMGGLAGLVRAWFALAFLTMIVNVFGLMLLGSKYSVALGILLAFLDILPIIGPGLIYIPWMVYQFVWGKLGVALGLLILYGGVSLLRQVIQTHLMGRELGLHPLVTLISLYVGFRLFGGAGLVYGPLSALFVKALWETGMIPKKGGERF